MEQISFYPEFLERWLETHLPVEVMNLQGTKKNGIHISTLVDLGALSRVLVLAPDLQLPGLRLLRS